jgi:hypothetical protein
LIFRENEEAWRGFTGAAACSSIRVKRSSKSLVTRMTTVISSVAAMRLSKLDEDEADDNDNDVVAVLVVVVAGVLEFVAVA